MLRPSGFSISRDILLLPCNTVPGCALPLPSTHCDRFPCIIGVCLQANRIKLCTEVQVFGTMLITLVLKSKKKSTAFHTGVCSSH